MNDMFRGCVDLTRLNISSFDTSKVKDMSGMFATTPVFVGSLADFGDISTYSPMSLEEIIGIESINTSSVENYGFVGMFQFNANLKRLDLSNFDTSKAIDLSSMFYGCSSLEYLNVTSFNTSRVTNMTQMFSNDESLTTIDLSSFDTSKVTSMSAMFMKCRSLTSLDLSNFVTPKLTDMSDMFAAANNLEYIDLSSFDVSKVTNYYQTFMSIRDFTVKMNGSSINSSADFTEMFSFSSPATIYVKTQADKQLLDGLNMYGVTVEVL
jgi:surface protein